MVAEGTVFETDLRLVDTGSFGLGRAVLKYKPCTVSEVIGYTVGRCMGLRTLPATAFWTEEPLEEEAFSAGRIGLLVQYRSDWHHISYEEASVLDCDQVVRALIFCLFDRDEWGEFGISGERVFFIDRERHLMALSPEHLMELDSKSVKEKLEKAVSSYTAASPSALAGVIHEAEWLGVAAAFQREFLQFQERALSIKERLRESLEGHPLAELLADASWAAFDARLRALCVSF
jgi:hypothetical protein